MIRLTFILSYKTEILTELIFDVSTLLKILLMYKYNTYVALNHSLTSDTAINFPAHVVLKKDDDGDNACLY